MTFKLEVAIVGQSRVLDGLWLFATLTTRSVLQPLYTDSHEQHTISSNTHIHILSVDILKTKSFIWTSEIVYLQDKSQNTTSISYSSNCF